MSIMGLGTASRVLDTGHRGVDERHRPQGSVDRRRRFPPDRVRGKVVTDEYGRVPVRELAFCLIMAVAVVGLLMLAR